MREMREDSHDIQTPKKEHLPVPSNRKAKQMNVSSKKLHHQQQKIVKKNLNSVLNSITEDDSVLNLPEKEPIEKFSMISESVDADQSTVEISKTSLTSDQTLVPHKSAALEHPEESVGIAPVSEAFGFGKDQSNDSIESYILSLNQLASPTSVTPNSVVVTPSSCTSPALSSITTVELTPFSSPITAEASPVYVSSGDGSTTEETNSTKLESVVKHLKSSMFQVFHSADIDPQYKKLLDALVKSVIEEFYSLHEERDMVFSTKIKTAILSFVLCGIAISSGIFLFSDGSSYNLPPPT